MIKKQVVKSCCGSKSYLITTDTAVRKSQAEEWKMAGYTIPPHFIKAGLFYIQRNGLVATASFGATKINVRCTKDEELEIFLELLDKLTSK